MKKTLLALLALLSVPAWALDAPDQQRLSSIQQEWAHIQYQLPEDQRTAAFEKLASESSAFTLQRPNAAEAWIWSGIVTSSWAGAQGGLGALSKVKQAKADLEKAMKKGDSEKINKRKDKLAESRKELQQALDELDK